ncbi:IS1182 family transposase (plasmid) [Spirosoma sp. SC4-14]|uniref:IS1182 family transposase n=1 Tax=Spirosoma sp. SC4-14 TaxID=3128900 RepID=UPI0030CD5924
MVGKKQTAPQQVHSLLLDQCVPQQNLYRRLKQAIDLTFLYETVKPYYGKCGQKSIDPISFVKLMLVGHLENLTSDRAIIRCCQLRLDILYFLDYELGEALPWHSTLSRTRQRLPEKVFERCFEYVLTQCIELGLVDGHTQAIDAAFVEANASLDKLEAKPLAKWTLEKNEQPLVDASDRLSFDKTNQYVNPKKVTRNNRVYYSPNDPQACLATKPNKAFRLYYLASMAVDCSHHVITHIQADFADEKDSRHLMTIVDRTSRRLSSLDLSLRCVLADAGFSSGENYAALEKRHIEAYIPLFGRYNRVRDPFTYEPWQDQYRCSYGAVLRNHGIEMAGGYGNYQYIASFSACQNCPIKESCCGKRDRKSLSVTMYYREYERMVARLASAKGKQLKRRRSAVVEPVFGSLLNYFGMHRTSSKGKTGAHKRMVMAATAYNLKKWLLAKRGPKVVTQVLALHPEDSFLTLWDELLQQPIYS